MLKKIAVDQLRLGMYIHSLGGAWIHHPFWRSQFLLDTAKDLQQLRASKIPELWIDLRRGLDVFSPTHTATSLDPMPEHTASAHTLAENSPLALELAQARQLCEQAREAVQDMFQEARMGKAIDVNTCTALVQEISDSLAKNPDALISVARLKTADTYTYMHSVAVSALMAALARQLGYSEEQVQQAALAGLLHDVGKARADIEILNKPGALTDAEFEHIKQHPVTGYRLLQKSVADTLVLDACLHHHERLDGKGYPDGLKGTQISELARMAAICDVYDAITSDRPYKRGWSPAIALRHMSQWCGNHLDERLFRAFVKTLGVYPVGSLVRLSNQELAVVFAPCAENTLVPKVVRFFDIDNCCWLRQPVLTDLRECQVQPSNGGGDALSIIRREDPNTWPFDCQVLEDLWQNACQASHYAEDDSQHWLACPALLAV
ncbi:MAG: HD-GYP domain-containing protein [Comamonas sp.]|nr:HD-GYP domain-containing protein [Comamonas sp.]